MESSKKILLSTIGIAILVVFLSGVTFAFFNYTRTGEANTIRVGRISFVTNQTDTISLTNLFPIDPTETGIMDDDTKVGTLEITIEGDTDYSEGIEYLVSSVDSEIYTSQGQTVPISLDVTVDDLGDSNVNYFTARESTNVSIYKKLVGDTLVGDQMLLVGYIAPNTTPGTTEGIDGSITIKAYLDKNKILISDTYDGTESDNMGTTNSMASGKTVITTSEWNALQSTGVSFKVRVEANEGIWVIGSLEEMMKTENLNPTTNQPIMDNVASEFVSASTGVDFSTTSSSTNGKGVYMRAGTENDANPILYYRGAVEDNNVKFANKCWKIVRTTDTGGVKMIYNGEVSANKAPLAESDYTIVTNTAGLTFDSTENAYTTTVTSSLGSSSDPVEFSFNVPADDDYIIQLYGTTSTQGSISNLTLFKGSSNVNGTGNGGGQPISLTHSFGTLTASDTIKITFFSQGTSESPSILYLKMIKPDSTLGMGCDNSGTASQITVNNTNTFAFNTSSNSPAYNGYMYGTVYTYSYSNWTSGARFGSSFTWDGTNYTLVDDETTTPNATHHYSCNVTTEGGTCTQIRYVYYMSGSKKYYITLTGGDGIEEALVKMQTNTNDSNAKDKIDTWYASNMNTVTNKLEDTIWCNDRSFGDNNNNGWIANGGSLSTQLYYGARERSNYAANTSTVKNQPSLACTNKNDAFTWKNSAGNQALDYPVGMITEDEIVLAGGLAGSTNGTFYLTTEAYYWSLSPYIFDNADAYEFGLNNLGSLNYLNVDATRGLRPAVSLKPGTPVMSGSGTAQDPYIIE